MPEPALQPSERPKAVLYRMVMPGHVCPYGLKARHLLRSRGYEVDDRWLTTREDTDAFKAKHQVRTTPQVFIDGERIGGHDDLRRHLVLKVADLDAVSYWPVVAVFATALTISVAVSWASFDAVPLAFTAMSFVSIAMMLLAMLKLQDIDKFSTMFLNYDLLAMRWVPYSRIYPFAEFTAGALMTARVLDWLSIPIALVIGGIGAISVFYAVYIQKRELKCACVGGSAKVPLGFVSLTENLAMLAMAIVMLFAY